MDISPELKQRFAEDCCIPIDIFTEPIFTSRLELFDRFYNTIERYNVFLQMLKERFTTYEMESSVTVTTYRKGTCIITAQSKENPEIKKECEVIIKDSSAPDVVESLDLDEKEIYLAVGSSRQLYATILPESLEDKRILWGTSDKSLATVYGGTVTALTKTTESTPCIITAMSNKDKSKTDTCIVHIVDSIEVTGLDFAYHQTELQIGAQERLKVNAVPANATSTNFQWSSSNTSVAEVVDGVVTAKAPGWCEIKVQSGAKDKIIQDTCYVLVHDIVPASQVLLNKSSMDMIVGGLARLEYEVLPEKCTNKEVVWSSSDESILHVDSETGLIQALGRGTATITATSKQNSYRYGQCLITVKPSLFVRDLQIDPEIKEIEKEQTFEIKSTVSVGYGVDPAIQWISSYEMLATVPKESEIQEPTQKSVIVHAQDYYNEYDTVKCRIVSHIKNSKGYNRFVNEDTDKWSVHCTCMNASIYTPKMDGHTMISISIDKAKFTPLYQFDPDIFKNLVAWENVVSTIGETDNDHIIYSENLLNEVAECCNLSRIEAYGRYILNRFYTDYVKPIIDALGKDENNQPYAELVAFGTSEIIIDTSKLTRIIDPNNAEGIVCTNKLIKLLNDIQRYANSYNCICPTTGASTHFPFIVRLFTLYKLKVEYEDEESGTIIDGSIIDGYMRNIYFEGNQPIEFVDNDPCQLPMLMRTMSHQAVTDEDRKFNHRGLVAAFTDDKKIHVPPITAIPDDPKGS